ncbi:Hypothetical_protein [Hexamita inflata]|uniref:Hypothetical_protein n=1 Tax=Hexamita inflata TaxID=28002 RepID=A0ABP1HHU0_9EUKA
MNILNSFQYKSNRQSQHLQIIKSVTIYSQNSTINSSSNTIQCVQYTHQHSTFENLLQTKSFQSSIFRQLVSSVQTLDGSEENIYNGSNLSDFNGNPLIQCQFASDDDSSESCDVQIYSLKPF